MAKPVKDRVRALVDNAGSVHKAALLLQVSDDSLVRCLADMPIRRGTLLLIENNLDAAEAAAPKAATPKTAPKASSKTAAATKKKKEPAAPAA